MERGRELPRAIGGGLGGIEQCHHASASERSVGIGKADRELSRLVTNRQRVERSPLDQALGRFHQIGSKAHVTLEGARKRLARDRAAQCLPRRGDPDAASGQPALEVGHRGAIRADDETDHLIDRPYRSAGGAKSLRPRRKLVPSGIEGVIVRSIKNSMSQAGADAGASTVSSSAGGGAKSSSLIQPAFAPACIVSASGASRERSNPSRAPG